MDRSIAWTFALATLAGSKIVAAAGLQFAFTVESGSSLESLQTSNPALYNNVLTGFSAAADRWKSIYKDPVTVRVNIDFPALGPSILGQANSAQNVYSYSAYRSALSNDASSVDDAVGLSSLEVGPNFTLRRRNVDSPATFVTNNSGNIASNVVVNRANARALGLVSNLDTASDAEIHFSSAFNWDFDPTDGISPGLYDFVGVATHELGHAMGFVSSVDDFDYFAEPDGPGKTSLHELQVNQYAWLNPLDLYRYSAPGVRNISFNQTSFFSLDAGALASLPLARTIPHAGHLRPRLHLRRTGHDSVPRYPLARQYRLDPHPRTHHTHGPRRRVDAPPPAEVRTLMVPVTLSQNATPNGAFSTAWRSIGRTCACCRSRDLA
jgi:hypothetical protein